MFGRTVVSFLKYVSFMCMGLRVHALQVRVVTSTRIFMLLVELLVRVRVRVRVRV